MNWIQTYNNFCKDVAIPHDCSPSQLHPSFHWYVVIQWLPSRCCSTIRNITTRIKQRGCEPSGLRYASSGGASGTVDGCAGHGGCDAGNCLSWSGRTRHRTLCTERSSGNPWPSPLGTMIETCISCILLMGWHEACTWHHLLYIYICIHIVIEIHRIQLNWCGVES